jgi:hypothetical protein
MKRLILALNVAAAVTACGGSGGTSPTVPKQDIERKADTKIADAGTPPGNDDGPAPH